MDMRSVPLTQLRDQLDEYVSLAASGETVLVTQGDHVVVEMVLPRGSHPVRPRLTASSQEVLAEPIRQGWITPPVLTSREPPPRAPVARLDEILAGLREDRDDR